MSKRSLSSLNFSSSLSLWVLKLLKIVCPSLLKFNEVNVPFLWQNTVKKPRTTKHLYTVVLQEGGSTVTKTVQLTLKQSRGTNARINNRLETIPSNSPTPPGSPVVKVSQRAGHFPVSSLGNHQWVNATGRQKREDGKALVWQTWRDYHLRVLSWSSQNISCFWSLTKRCAKFFSNIIIFTLVTQCLPFSFLSSRPVAWVHYLLGTATVKAVTCDNIMKRHFEQNRNYSHSPEFLDTVIRFRKRENHSLSCVESHK